MQKNNFFISQILPIIVYPLGDLIAQLILSEFNLFRSLALLLTAALIYRLEIPKWFNILDNLKIKTLNTFTSIFFNAEKSLNWCGKTIGAIFYFNPLWIARHMFIIKLGMASFVLANPIHDFITCLSTGGKSFLVNLPLSIAGNFIVQAKLPLNYRFLGSVILTSIFAIAYAVAYKFF